MKSKVSNNTTEKSEGEGKMNRSSIALVLTPGQLSKAYGKDHPAKVTKPNTNTKSDIPYEGHTERMKLAKMAAERMLGASKPESEKKYSDTQAVDHKGREAGGKAPYSGYGTGVSGDDSRADNLYGAPSYLVSPSELGAGKPEGATAHTPVKNVRKR